MNLIPKLIAMGESAPLPDFILKSAVNFLVGNTKNTLKNETYNDYEFAKEMQNFPIAMNTEDANQQHYELPSKFFELCLGENKKYSCCYYDEAIKSLNDAENLALKMSCENAQLINGQEILELGCGWGSLSLYMAQHYPNSRIISVSNSHSQRKFIESEIKKRGINNLTVITCDMNDFYIDKKFDRIVSIEMFEHMSNWHELLKKCHNFIKSDGKLFIHIFTHKSHSYRFLKEGEDDWIAQYFFAGGIMPSEKLMFQFKELFDVESHITWNGENYKKTALDWLKNFDNNIDEIEMIFEQTYGKDKDLWLKRWRLFFLSTAGLFGYDNGNEWFVSRYLLNPNKP